MPLRPHTPQSQPALMVQRVRSLTMSSDQPLKKKLRRDSEATTTTTTTTTPPPTTTPTTTTTTGIDEPDYIRIAENGMRNELSALHLSLAPNINEADITLNSFNAQFHAQFFCEGDDREVKDVSKEPAPNIAIAPTTPAILTTALHHNKIVTVVPSAIVHCQRNLVVDEHHTPTDPAEDEADCVQKALIAQCLCGVSEARLRAHLDLLQPNEGGDDWMEWAPARTMHFLANLQLLFDVYLKQNNAGAICARVVDVCNELVRGEHSVVERMIALNETRNKYVGFMLARVLSSFLIVAKADVNREWLELIVGYLSLERIDYYKLNFALEVIKRVVEWKDVEIHVLEESTSSSMAASRDSATTSAASSCSTIHYSDSESFDTTSIKGIIIRSLETKWPDLIAKIQLLIRNNNCMQTQTCILTFLALWESIISVRANLSVIDTKPFHAHLESFASLFLSNPPLPSIVWKQLLSLFNEVLCYGSTLALQDMLPDDICKVAYVIVRHVKDYRVLERLPYRCVDGYTVQGFVGTIPATHSSQTMIDKTLLQKMVLLVLKSVAVTVKETRTDSSDSSVGSDDYDYYQDMQLIERSIRDVLKKVDVFIKNSLDFHPETQFYKQLIHLFSDQDDYMIESMVCTLDITIGISYRNAIFPDLVNMLNPVMTFIEFLKIVSHGSDVLLDFLVSNETCFLLYLLRFLKYIRRNWAKFLSSCQSSSTMSRENELDNTMTVLIRLKGQIKRLVDKDLFPYNIYPILKLLDECENMYEDNDYS